MTYTDDKQYFAAYTYGLERIEVEALDETRPESQDPLYYLYDGLGSVAYMVKPDGNTRDHYNYDEYGKPAPGNSKLSPDGAINLHNTFGYTGEMWDEESRLLYLRARYYEPEMGRFLSRDTYEGELENPLSRNLYSYVENNPVNHKDPSGHAWWIEAIDDQPNVQGIYAHSAFSFYMNAMFGGLAFSPLQFPSGKRADLFLGLATAIEGYELKPISYHTNRAKLKLAKDQLSGYISEAKKYFASFGIKKTVKKGTYLPVNGWVIPSLNYSKKYIKLYTYYQEKGCEGLIFYTYTNKGNKNKNQKHFEDEFMPKKMSLGEDVLSSLLMGGIAAAGVRSVGVPRLVPKPVPKPAFGW